MSGMSTTTANWHWKHKTVTPWARQWMERELPKISITGSQSVSVGQVTRFEGDVEIGQRKSKIITIFDCELELEWSGTASDGTEVKGKLSLPEVSHEITVDRLSDYSYSWSLSTPSSPAVDAVYQLARTSLPPALEAKLAEFPVALVEVHGKDIQVATPDPSRGGTPTPSAPPSAPAVNTTSATAAAAATSAKTSKVNTTTVSVSATFMASADDLFGLLTDPNRIPHWTRAPAQSDVKVDGIFSLFGGGVTGTYATVEPPKTLVQNWVLRSPQWPTDHAGQLTTTLEQSSDSTKVTWSLKGVPFGMEDEIERNLDGYYIRGLKSIGYVQLVPYEPPPPVFDKHEPRLSDRGSTRSFTAIVLAVLAFFGAVSYRFVS